MVSPLALIRHFRRLVCPHKQYCRTRGCHTANIHCSSFANLVVLLLVHFIRQYIIIKLSSSHGAILSTFCFIGFSHLTLLMTAKRSTQSKSAVYLQFVIRLLLTRRIGYCAIDAIDDRHVVGKAAHLHSLFLQLWSCNILHKTFNPLRWTSKKYK